MIRLVWLIPLGVLLFWAGLVGYLVGYDHGWWDRHAGRGEPVLRSR